MALGEITFIDRIARLVVKTDLRWKKDGNGRIPSLRSPGATDKEHAPIVIARILLRISPMAFVMVNVETIMDLAIQDPETADPVADKTSTVQQTHVTVIMMKGLNRTELMEIDRDTTIDSETDGKIDYEQGIL